MNTWSETIIMSKPLRDVRLVGAQLASECPTITAVQSEVPPKVHAPAPIPAPKPVLAREDQDQLHAAYDRGRIDGEKSVSEQLIKQRGEMNELFQGIMKSMSEAVPQVVRDTENTLVSLALEVAQKLVAEMPISTEMVEAAIQDALGQVEGTAQVTIRLHPADLEILQNSSSLLLENSGGATEFRFLGSPEVTRGGCLVQTRFGIVDARRETKFDLLKRNLLP
ncbi:MAG TPA: FliH/SctL family protein [Verrucomicrobiae bacterium]|jgi:flagellar assembly protein FliH